MTGPPDELSEERVTTTTWTFPVSSGASKGGSISASLPGGASCSSPLCISDGRWQLQLQPLLGETQAILLDFSQSSSHAQQISHGAISFFQSVRLCATDDWHEGCGDAAPEVILVLLPSSSCIALVAQEVPALLQTTKLAALRCPEPELIRAYWPQMLQDPSLSATCVPLLARA